MDDPDKRDLARLAFWAMNMMMAGGEAFRWPGFTYRPEEWQRLHVLSAAVPAAAFARFLTIATLLFLALAAIGIVGIFLPVLLVLFPDPAATPAWKFALILAMVCLLVIGLGLPLSLRLASAWSSDADMLARLEPAPGDAALAAKVRWQITRMTVIMCGLLVPGVVLFVAYDIEAGPLITALKWTAFGLMLLSGLAAARGRGRV